MTCPTAHQSCVVWLCGLSGAGKTTIARIAVRHLKALRCKVFLLDGDAVRKGLSKDLGFSGQDRAESLRRAAEVASLLANDGFIVIAAFITPLERDRTQVRDVLIDHLVIEVFVDTPLEIAESRDVKGLYVRARKGEIRDFTGISSPFEVPIGPDLRLDTTKRDAESLADELVGVIARHILA